MEDIGVLPGKSIAESLITLPGVTGALNDDGKYASLSVRGAQDQALSTLNGRELVTTLRGSRSVDFSLYPSTIIASAQVYKTSKASLTEGGLSGVINMNTLRPRDFDERSIIFAGEGSYNDAAGEVPWADEWGGRVNVAFIKPWSDELGFVASFAYANEPIVQVGSLSPFNWGSYFYTVPPEFVTDLDGDGQSGDENLPWGFIGRHQSSTDERKSAFLSLDWDPTDSITTSLDFLYSESDSEGEAQHNQWQNFVYNSAAGISNMQFAGDDLYSATIVLDPWNIPDAVGANMQFYQQRSEVINAGYNVKYQADGWALTGDFSYSKAESLGDWESANLRMDQATALTFDYQAYGDHPSLVVSGSSTTDPTLWTPTSWFTLGISTLENEDELKTIRFDFDKFFDDSLFTSLNAGVRYYERSKRLDTIDSEASFRSGNVWSPNYDPNWDTSPFNESLVAGTYSASNAPDMLLWDFARIVEHLGGYQKVESVANINTELASSWQVDEDSYAFYGQLTFASESIPLSGNFGLRYVDTESVSTGWADLQDGNPAVPTREGNEYDEWLPSLNLSYAVTDDHNLRLGYGKVMARPNVDDMRSSSAVYLNIVTGLLEGSGGNPKISPTVANQLTASYEWYPRDETVFTFSGHYSNLDSFVAKTSIMTEINGMPAQIASIDNGDGGYIRGWETSLIHSFSHLPGAWSGLGVSGNYAHTESNVEPDATNKFGLVGLSEHVANVGAWWANDRFEFRVGADYRSEYRDISAFGVLLTIDDITVVSTNLAYNFTDTVRVNFYVNNLTDATRRQYTDDIPARGSSSMNFGRIYGLGFHIRL